MRPTRTPPWTGELLLRHRPSSQKGPNTLGGPTGYYDELITGHSLEGLPGVLPTYLGTHEPKGYGNVRGRPRSH